MKNVITILKKQLTDTIKNKTVLIQFILFPVMSLIMENLIHMDGMPEHYFMILFSIMYIGMAPLTATAAIISEEKEKNTLRVLMMAGVKPGQYLLGIGSYVWVICIIGATIMGVSAGLSAETLVFYYVITGVGFLASILLGASVGVFAKNQMMATSIVMPVMLVFAFVPMISMFNDTIEKVAKLTYTGQMNLLLFDMHFDQLGTQNVGIIFCNLILFAILFGVAFKKNGLD